MLSFGFTWDTNSSLLCSSPVSVWRVHPPRPFPYTDFVAVSPDFLPAPVITATRGCHLTVNIKCFHKPLLVVFLGGKSDELQIQTRPCRVPSGLQSDVWLCVCSFLCDHGLKNISRFSLYFPPVPYKTLHLEYVQISWIQQQSSMFIRTYLFVPYGGWICNWKTRT